MKDTKTIPGFPGYEISKSGELISTKKGSPVKIVGSIWQGYRQVKLSNGSKLRNVRIHTLVAEAFLAKRKGMDRVNHIDGNKQNNHVSNLEWTNHIGNMDHYSEKLAPIYKAKKAKEKQDRIKDKLSVVTFAYGVYKNDPEAFTKLVATTFELN